MIIRRATREDAKEIARLAALSSGAAVWSARQYAKIIESPKEYLALVAGDPAGELSGFLVARLIVDEIEIQNIAVEPDSRSKGLGSGLLGEVLKLAAESGASSVLLEVRESNIVARKLYEKHGFSEEGRRHGYYSGPPEDAILYRKNLGPATPENA